MNYSECVTCGAVFTKRAGAGRPRKHCDACRDTKHDAAHDKVRRQTIAGAYGTACARCGEDMTVGHALGEPELDHDDDNPGRYLGYSHSHCNRSAGAKKGNANPSPKQLAQRQRWAAQRVVWTGLPADLSRTAEQQARLRSVLPSAPPPRAERSLIMPYEDAATGAVRLVQWRPGRGWAVLCSRRWG
jgi:hypothetical protein